MIRRRNYEIAVRRRNEETSAERQLRHAREGLDNAIYFKYPDSQIAMLRAEVERLSAEPTRRQGRSLKAEQDEQLVKEAFNLAQSIDGLTDQIVKAKRRLHILETDLREAVRLRDPDSVIQKMRDESIAVRDEYDRLHETRDAVMLRLSEMAGPQPAPVKPVQASEFITDKERARLREEAYAKQRRTYDGRQIDDETAHEIDMLVDSAKRGVLSKTSLWDSMQTNRARLQNSDITPRERREIENRLMIIDHVMAVGFTKQNRPRRYS